MIGYMYGGIYSTVAETSFDPSTEASQTGASNQVFEVMLTPTGACASVRLQPDSPGEVVGRPI